MVTCAEPSCEREAKVKGRCKGHHASQWRRDMKAAQPRCEVDGCETRQYARLLCLTHYRRWNRTGSTEDRPAHRVPLPKPQPPTIANLIDGTCTICNQPDTSHGWCESRDAAICRLCEHHSCEGAL